MRGYVNARRYGVMPPYRWGRIWRDEGIAPYRRGRIWRQMAVGTFLHTQGDDLAAGLKGD